MKALLFVLLAGSVAACPFLARMTQAQAAAGAESIKASVGTSFGYQPQYTGSDWQKQTGYTKMMSLWTRMYSNRSSQAWYGTLSMAALFTESLDTSFDYYGDDMPSQNLGLSERAKLIHTVGAISLAKFTVTNVVCNYTGLFQSGSQNAFIRYSLATKPTATTGIVPGVSLKFLRDSVPSGNVFAMYSLTGQTSYNFFEHDLSNHPPAFDLSKAPTQLGLLGSAFAKASATPTMLGLSSLAGYDSSGVGVENPNFPFRIILHPTKTMHTKFSASAPSPFSENYYVSQLSGIASGTDIFDVYVVPYPVYPGSKLEDLQRAQADNCYGATPIKIGKITTSGPTVASYFADHDLFFQHTRMEDDLYYRPEFTEGTQEIYDAQESEYPPELYQDLPFA